MPGIQDLLAARAQQAGAAGVKGPPPAPGEGNRPARPTGPPDVSRPGPMLPGGGAGGGFRGKIQQFMQDNPNAGANVQKFLGDNPKLQAFAQKAAASPLGQKIASSPFGQKMQAAFGGPRTPPDPNRDSYAAPPRPADPPVAQAFRKGGMVKKAASSDSGHVKWR